MPRRTQRSLTDAAAAMKKPSRGMTLVELMVTIPIMLIAGGIVLVLLYNYTSMFFANNDVVAASRRAEIIFRILAEPVQHAGLGINTETEATYKDAWDNKVHPNAPFPAEWGDAIVLSGDETTETYTSVGILYAVPTGLKIRETKDGGFTAPFDIALIDYNLPASIANLGDVKDVRSWMTIPGTNRSVPMFIDSYNVGTKTLTATIHGVIPNNFVLPMNQELYRMKAIVAYVAELGGGKYEFRVAEITDGKNYNGAGTEYIAQVENIRAARFRLSDDRKFLEVRVLAMGDSADANHSQTLAPELRSRWRELTNEDAKYYFSEFEVKWRVRDLYDRS